MRSGLMSWFKVGFRVRVLVLGLGLGARVRVRVRVRVSTALGRGALGHERWVRVGVRVRGRG